jgi:hypothetical protein
MSPVVNTNNVLGSKLNKLVKESKTADAALTSIASRARIRGFTDIARLKMELESEGFDVIDKELEGLFKNFQAEGLGVIVRPRKFGGKARFIWKYNMKDVASAAINGKDIKAEELPKDMQRVSDGSRKPKPESKERVKRKYTKKVTTKPASIHPGTKKPKQINLNGQNFVAMSPEEYLNLSRLKEVMKNL